MNAAARGERRGAAGHERRIVMSTTGANRVAVVTGGSAGIGRVICEQLLAQGCEVISLARRRTDDADDAYFRSGTT